MIPTTFEGGFAVPDTKKRNRLKISLETLEFNLVFVNTLLPVGTGVFLPLNGFVVGGSINIIVPVPAASVPIVDVGTASASESIIANANVTTSGSKVTTNDLSISRCSGEEITFTLGSLDFDGFEAQGIVLVVVQEP